jgi:hypothetical protein
LAEKNVKFNIKHRKAARVGIFFCRDAIFSFTFFAAENAVFFSWFFALFLQTAHCAAKHGSIFLAPPTFGGECNNL